MRALEGGDEGCVGQHRSTGLCITRLMRPAKIFPVGGDEFLHEARMSSHVGGSRSPLLLARVAAAGKAGFDVSRDLFRVGCFRSLHPRLRVEQRTPLALMAAGGAWFRIELREERMFDLGSGGDRR